MNTIEAILDRFVRIQRETDVLGEVFWIYAGGVYTLCVSILCPWQEHLPDDLREILMNTDHLMCIASGYTRWRCTNGEIESYKESIYHTGLCTYIECTSKEYAEVVARHEHDWGNLVPAVPNIERNYGA